VHFVDVSVGPAQLDQLHRFGTFIVFLFLVCGAGRLARFNIQKNPVPKNPGRPDRKYFVGLPIPAAAAAVASVVYALGSEPITSWQLSIVWIAIMGLLGFLMVSTWRYYSFKDINLRSPRSPLILVALSAMIYGFWNYSQIMMLGLSMAYVLSGIVVRAAGLLRRMRPARPKTGDQIA
jgi:CDP-diacylglycerol--serine O-phosphatidyltransferase